MFQKKLVIVFSLLVMAVRLSDALYIVKNTEKSRMSTNTNKKDDGFDVNGDSLSSLRKRADNSHVLHDTKIRNWSDLIDKMRVEEDQVNDSMRKAMERQERLNEYFSELELEDEKRRESNGINKDHSHHSSHGDAVAMPVRDAESTLPAEGEAVPHEIKADDNLQGEELMKKLAEENAKAEEQRKVDVVPFLNSKDENEANKNLQGEELMKKLSEEDTKSEENRKVDAVPSSNDDVENEAEFEKEVIDDENKAIDNLQGEELMEKLADEDEKAENYRLIDVVPSLNNDETEAGGDEHEVKDENEVNNDLEGKDLMKQLEKEDKVAEDNRQADESEVVENLNEAFQNGGNNTSNQQTKKSERDRMIKRLAKQSDEDNKLLKEMIEKLRDGNI